MFSAPSSLAVRVEYATWTSHKTVGIAIGRDDDPSEASCSPCHHGSSQLAASLPPSVHLSTRCRHHHRTRLRRHRNRHPTARPSTLFIEKCCCRCIHAPSGRHCPILSPDSTSSSNITIPNQHHRLVSCSSCRAASPLSSTLPYSLHSHRLAAQDPRHSQHNRACSHHSRILSCVELASSPLRGPIM